jgi:3-deoxy-D-manno-octulosonic-acid transferase
VSAGETKTIVPILRRIEHAYPETDWVISTTTQAGYQMARKIFTDRFIFYFPLDIGFIVRKVIRRVNPGLIILMELEIWPNLLYEADRWGAPVVIINGRISEKSFKGYRKLKKLLPEMDRISLFSVQNREYRDRLRALDVPTSKIEITGNLKYDGIDTSEVLDSLVIREELKLSASDRILVAGSTHEGEDGILLDLFLHLVKEHPALRLVLVPRHLERVDDIEKECVRRRLHPVRRTSIDRKAGTLTHHEVLILDTIGELDRVYAAADLVFVGGSLVPTGGHNMMEPAGKGKPVLFGPHIFNFSEDVALLESAKAAVMVKDGKELEVWIDRLLHDEVEMVRLGRVAREVVSRAKGATERNFELIDRIFLKEVAQKQR